MLLQALCSISYPLVHSNLSYSPETPNLGQIRRFLAPCDLEIWRMTLKNNRAPLLSNIKLYIKFHHHMWIQTGVTVRKRSSWVVTSVTLTFDLWPWPFAWTLAWSMVITPKNFMMIRWWEHSQKGVTDGQTDRRTDRRTDRQTDRRTENTIHRAAWSQLKIEHVAAGNNIHAKPDIWDQHLLFAPRWSFGDVVATKKAPVSSDIISNGSHNRICTLNIDCTLYRGHGQSVVGMTFYYVDISWISAIQEK